VQKDTRAVSKKWWRSFSHDYVLAAIQTKFREVIAHVQLVLLSLGDFDSDVSTSDIDEGTRVDWRCSF
jgi:hypothetical protein